MIWLIVWAVLAVVIWMMQVGDDDWERTHGDRKGQAARSPVLQVAIAVGGSWLVLLALAMLLDSPGLWNALSMGQR